MLCAACVVERASVAAGGSWPLADSIKSHFWVKIYLRAKEALIFALSQGSLVAAARARLRPHPGGAQHGVHAPQRRWPCGESGNHSSENAVSSAPPSQRHMYQRASHVSGGSCPLPTSARGKSRAFPSMSTHAVAHFLRNASGMQGRARACALRCAARPCRTRPRWPTAAMRRYADTQPVAPHLPC